MHRAIAGEAEVMRKATSNERVASCAEKGKAVMRKAASNEQCLASCGEEGKAAMRKATSNERYFQRQFVVTYPLVCSFCVSLFLVHCVLSILDRKLVPASCLVMAGAALVLTLRMSVELSLLTMW